MLGPSLTTPYDLRFQLLGIPVSVNPFFWVVAALLGWRWLNVEPGGPANLITWILCVFVSLIVHEFGHALTARAFGHYPNVILYHFGGLAIYRGRETAGRSFLITAAGPGAQFVLFGLVAVLAAWLAATGRYPEDGTPADAALDSLLWINLLWPLINLVPVLPLDGGRLLESFLALCGVRTATEWSLRAGVFCGVAAAVVLLVYLNAMLAGMMFAFLAMDSYRTLKGMQHGPW